MWQLYQSKNGVIQWTWSNCETVQGDNLSWVPLLSNSSCTSTTCPNPASPRLCTVVTSAGIQWDLCSSRHTFLCSVGQGQLRSVYILSATSAFMVVVVSLVLLEC